MKENTTKQFSVAFNVDTYRNGHFHSSKKEFCIISGNETLMFTEGFAREKIRQQASHLIKEGKSEVYEMVHGSCFGEKVTIERELGHIMSMREVRPIETPTDYSHAYAEDSRYNYNG